MNQCEFCGSDVGHIVKAANAESYFHVDPGMCAGVLKSEVATLRKQLDDGHDAHCANTAEALRISEAEIERLAQYERDHPTLDERKWQAEKKLMEEGYDAMRTALEPVAK